MLQHVSNYTLQLAVGKSLKTAASFQKIGIRKTISSAIESVKYNSRILDESGREIMRSSDSKGEIFSDDEEGGFGAETEEDEDPLTRNAKRSVPLNANSGGEYYDMYSSSPGAYLSPRKGSTAGE